MKLNDQGPRMGIFLFIALSVTAVALGTIYPGRLPALEAFKGWQDLTGGALALLAAAYAANYVKDQIAQTERLHAEDRERRLRAQRAVMPRGITPTIQEHYIECADSDVDQPCGWKGVASFEIIRTTTQSANPNPRIVLPTSPPRARPTALPRPANDDGMAASVAL